MGVAPRQQVRRWRIPLLDAGEPGRCGGTSQPCGSIGGEGDRFTIRGGLEYSSHDLDAFVGFEKGAEAVFGAGAALGVEEELLNLLPDEWEEGLQHGGC